MAKITQYIARSTLFGRRNFCNTIASNAASTNIIEKWTDKLTNENVPEVGSSIYHILRHVLKTKQLDTQNINNYAHTLTVQQRQHFEQLCEDRLDRKPLEYILEEWKFRDLKLKMRPPVLVPWIETEGLVDVMLKHLNPNKKIRFMEIGCGSGAICVSLLKALPMSTCIAIDLSNVACQLTLENATKYNCADRMTIIRYKLTKDSWTMDFGEPFDMIVSNPPYVTTPELIDLSPEMKLYQDIRALNGGNDGTNILKLVLTLAQKQLKNNGQLWFEVNPLSIEVVQTHLNDLNNNLSMLKYQNTFKDLNNTERYLHIAKT